MKHIVTTTKIVTLEYDDEGRIVREVTETVEKHEEAPPAEEAS